MKTTTPHMLALINSRSATLATCWKLTRTDSVVLGFTSHTHDLVIGGLTYTAKTGYTPTAVVDNYDLSVPNLDLEGLLKEGGITEFDIRAGVYDYADVLITWVDYTNPNAGQIIIRRGNIGQVTLRHGIYVSEIRGLAQLLQRTFIRVYEITCDAELYDNRCKKLPAAFQNNFTVVSQSDPKHFIFNITSGPGRPTGYFVGGKFTMITGAGAGRSADIKSYTVAGPVRTAGLYLSFPWPLAPGDTGLIQRGCDKTSTTCKGVFDNLVNHRGFPAIPGYDRMLQYPDVKI